MGATYQRPIITLLHDIIHEVEIYIDDMIVKSNKRSRHLTTLTKLRLNPQKGTFSVTIGNLLGFHLTQRGVEVDPTKIMGIVDMLPPKNKNKIRGFIERIQLISRFISKLIGNCNPLFIMLDKGKEFEWNE